MVEFTSQEFYVNQPLSGTAVLANIRGVVRSGTTGPATFLLNSTNGTAFDGNGGDYVTVSNYSAQIPATQDIAPFSVGLNATGNSVQPLFFFLSLSGTQSGPQVTQAGAYNQATVYILTAGTNNASVVQFDSGGYTVSQAPDSINTVQLSVQRTGNLNQTTTVNYITAPGSAQANVDYLTTYGTLVFAPSEASKTIDVTINPTSNPTGSLTFNVVLSNIATATTGSGGPSVFGNITTSTVTIQPNPQVNVISFLTPSFSVVPGAVTPIGVQLERPLLSADQPVTVQVYTNQGTAAAGVDYTSIPQASPVTITFAPYQTYATFNVTTLGTSHIDTRSFYVKLVNAINATLSANDSAEVQILGQNSSGEMQFNQTAYVVNEADGQVTLNVGLMRTGTGAASFSYVVSPGSAMPSRYGYVTTGTVTFLPLLTGTAMSLAGINQTWLTGNTDGIISISGTNYIATNSVIIQSQTVLDGSSGTVALIKKTISSGASQAQIQIPIIDDNLVEPPQDFSVTLVPVSGSGILGPNSTATVTISDNDGDNYVEFQNDVYGDAEPFPSGYAYITGTTSLGSSKTVPVRLKATRNGGTGVLLKVDYELIADTAVPGVNYVDSTGTISFAPGDNVADIPLVILGDGLNAGTKTFRIRLKQSQTPEGRFTSIGRNAEVVFKIFDSDVPVNQVQFLTPEVTVMEGGPALIVPVIRAGPFNGNVTVATIMTRQQEADMNPLGETAVPFVDYTPINSQVTFNLLRRVDGTIYAQETLKYVVIPILDNGKITGDQFFNIRITQVDNASYGTQLIERVIIRDAEMGNQLSFAQNDFLVYRYDPYYLDPGTGLPLGSQFANVKVNLLPTGNTAITSAVDYQVSDITAINGVDYAAYAGTIIFSPGDFRAMGPTSTVLTKTISIPLLPDAMWFGQSKQFRVSLFDPSSGAVFAPPSASFPHPSNATVTIVDGYNASLPYVNVSVPVATITGNGVGQFVISRTGPTTSDLVVNYSIRGTASADVDYVLPSGASVVKDATGLNYLVGSGTIPAGSGNMTLPIQSKPHNGAQPTVTAVLTVEASPQNALDQAHRGTYLAGGNPTDTITINASKAPGLSVYIQADNVTPTLGDQVGFTITVTNNPGDKDARNVLVTQTLPATVSYISSDWGNLVTTSTSGSTTAGAISGTGGITLSIPVGLVPVGASIVIHTVVLPRGPITFESQATITAQALDSYYFDDTSTSTVSVKQAVVLPKVSVAGTGDGFELTQLVTATGVSFLGSYPGQVTFYRTGDVSLPLDVYYAILTGTTTVRNGTLFVTPPVSGSTVTTSTLAIPGESFNPLPNQAVVPVITDLNPAIYAAGSAWVRVPSTSAIHWQKNGTWWSPVVVTATGVAPVMSGVYSATGGWQQVRPLQTGSATVGHTLILAGTDSAVLPIDPVQNGKTTGDQTVAVGVLSAGYSSLLYPTGSGTGIVDLTGTTYLISPPSVGTMLIHDADVPNVSVTASVPTASELSPIATGTGIRLGSLNGAFTVSRGSSTAFPLVLGYTVAGTAASGTDYTLWVSAQTVQGPLGTTTIPAQQISGSSGNLTIPAFCSAIQVVVKPVPNTKVDGPRTVSLTLVAATPPQNTAASIQLPLAYNVTSGRDTAVVTILDKQTVYFTQGVADRTAVRGGRNGRVVFNRIGSGLANGVTVSFSVEGGISGTDYQLYQGSTLVPTRSAPLQLSPTRRIGSLTFGKNVTILPLTIRAITRNPSPNITPLIFTIQGSSYYQYAGSTYRALVNLVPGSTF